jgi:hypothetical protein
MQRGNDMAESLRDALNQALCDELDAAMSRIAHCVNQLTTEQLWSRSRADMNSVGNLVLHLTGNVRQRVVNNLTGAPDTRDRPAEFAARGPIPADQLLGGLSAVVKEARAAVLAAIDERLCEKKSVNNFNLTGIEAAVRSIAHFRGHTQEIIHMTRTILGDRYQYAGPR